MKKTAVLMMAAAIVFTGFGSKAEANTSVVNANAESHVVYYVPHQDDEALTFGLSIMNHLNGGHNVHVVLMTDGSNSRVRGELGMTRSEFSAARNREFAYSLDIMGVKKENIHYMNIPDGSLTFEQSKKIIADWEAKYPNAKHKTFSETDPHPDHANIGKALRELTNQGITADARFYVKQQDNPAGISLIKHRWNEEYRAPLLAVSYAYALENPVIGFYGIGHKSVGKSFAMFEQQPISRYHK